MSNAKWQKFFCVIAEIPEHLFAATWKLIDEVEPEKGGLPESRGVLEDAVDGCLNGPVDYNRIEWIELPRSVPYRLYEKAPLRYHVQDLETLRQKLKKVGHFPIDETDVGIRVYGYRRKAT